MRWSWGGFIGSSCCLCELEEVVGGADEGPLAFDLGAAPQQELSEATSKFDLTEDGLDDLLAKAVARAMPTLTEFFPHRSRQRTFLLCSSSGFLGIDGLVIRGDVSTHASSTNRR